MPPPEQGFAFTPETQIDLRVYLESLHKIGAKAHHTVAETLLKAFRASSSGDERKVLTLEIVAKLTGLVEDVGAFCLLWLNYDPANPMAKLLGFKTRHIVNFYRDCDKGLTDVQFDLIYGLHPAEELLGRGILRAPHRAEYERRRDEFYKGSRTVFGGFAKVFTTNTTPDAKQHGDCLNMYFNTKHGYRIIHPDSVAPYGMKVPDDEVAVLIGPSKTNHAIEGRPVEMHNLHYGGYPVSDAFVAKAVENCFYIGKTLASMAEERLHWIDDPLYMSKKLAQNVGEEVGA